MKLFAHKIPPIRQGSAFLAITIGALLLLPLLLPWSNAVAQRWRNFSTSPQPVPSSRVVIEYMAHLQDTGDTPYITQPGLCGTTGERRRLEGFAIRHSSVSQDTDVGLAYMVYVQKSGWQDWTYMPDYAGTKNQGLRVEALKIEVVNSDEYSVYYKAYLQGTRWTPWAKDGEECGTEDQGRRVEAIEIMVVDKMAR